MEDDISAITLQIETTHTGVTIEDLHPAVLVKIGDEVFGKVVLYRAVVGNTVVGYSLEFRNKSEIYSKLYTNPLEYQNMISKIYDTRTAALTDVIQLIEHKDD